MCRKCRSSDETVTHIVGTGGSKKLAQRDYKRRHDTVAKALHWEICKKYGFKSASQWYEHEPESVLENEDWKVLWDFTIQTDRVIQARRPDIVIVDKKSKVCQIVDIAVPGDCRVEIKEDEKIEKYQDLAREISKLWKVKAKVIPIHSYWCFRYST